MNISEFAAKHGRMVVIHGSSGAWYAAIEKTGFVVGFVEHTVHADTPQKALEALCREFSNQTLVFDGNTDNKRDIVAPYLAPY